MLWGYSGIHISKMSQPKKIASQIILMIYADTMCEVCVKVNARVSACVFCRSVVKWHF